MKHPERVLVAASSLAFGLSLSSCGDSGSHNAQSVGNISPFLFTEQSPLGDTVAVQTYCGGFVVKAANESNNRLLISPSLAEGLDPNQTDLKIVVYPITANNPNYSDGVKAKGKSPIDVSIPKKDSEVLIEGEVVAGIDGGVETDHGDFTNVCPSIYASIQASNKPIKVTIDPNWISNSK